MLYRRQARRRRHVLRLHLYIMSNPSRRYNTWSVFRPTFTKAHIYTHLASGKLRVYRYILRRVYTRVSWTTTLSHSYARSLVVLSSNDLERNHASFSRDKLPCTRAPFFCERAPLVFFHPGIGRVMTCRCRNFGNLFTVIVFRNAAHFLFFRLSRIFRAPKYSRLRCWCACTQSYNLNDCAGCFWSKKERRAQLVSFWFWASFAAEVHIWFDLDCLISDLPSALLRYSLFPLNFFLQRLYTYKVTGLV